MTNRQMVSDSIDRIENLVYETLERKYIKVQFITTGLVYLTLFILTSLLLLSNDFIYRNIIIISLECLIIISAIINLSVLPKAYRYKGYAIREHDISYRTGIFFPKITTISFSRIQQVSIRQNPISRFFGLYSVDIVNGAQMLDKMTIPGLSEEKANKINAFLIENIRNEKR